MQHEQHSYCWAFFPVQVYPLWEQINASWWKASRKELPAVLQDWIKIKLHIAIRITGQICMSCYDLRPRCISFVFQRSVFFLKHEQVLCMFVSKKQMWVTCLVFKMANILPLTLQYEFHLPKHLSVARNSTWQQTLQTKCCYKAPACKSQIFEIFGWKRNIWFSCKSW